MPGWKLIKIRGKRKINKFPKSFKKTAIILVAIVLLISLATVFVVIFNNNKKQKVYVSNWDGTDMPYVRLMAVIQ